MGGRSLTWSSLLSSLQLRETGHHRPTPDGPATGRTAGHRHRGARHVPRSRNYDTPTKTGDLRIVTLDPATLELVAKLRAAHESAGPWLFIDGPESPHPGRVGYWWKEAKDRSGIDITWRLHDLRHWSATHGVSEGFDMATISGRLGHSDASTTLRVYAHAKSREDEKLAQSLGDALRRR